MNDRRRLFKKIFIAVIYAAVFGMIGTGIYFLVRPAPLPPSPPAPIIYPIEIIWSQAFTSDANLYSVAAKVRNPNTNFGASQFDYNFYLYDANNVLIKTLRGESFIWPGESKHIIQGGVNLPKVPLKTIFEINNPAWHEVPDFKGVSLTLENVKYGKGAPGSGKFFVVDFTSNNGTPFDLKKVYVSAIVFNKEGLPIAAGSTILENLKSRERRPFGIPWFLKFSGAAVSVDLNISTNLWETPELLTQ